MSVAEHRVPVQHGERVVRDLVKPAGGVPREVAGYGAVPKVALRKALGTARLVYDELLRLRSPKTGIVLAITAKLLARKLPRVGRGEQTSERAMKHHLQKLTALGLVETVVRDEKGMTKRRLYYQTPTGKTTWKRVVDRRVYGAPVVGASELFAVPRKVQLVIEMAAGHGGARAGAGGGTSAGGPRKGAGRPKGVKNGAGRSRFSRHTPGNRGMSAERLIAETERLWEGSTSAVKNQLQVGPKIQSLGPLYSPLLSSLLFPDYRKRTPVEASLTNVREGVALRAPAPVLLSGEPEQDLAPSKPAPVISPFTRGLPHRLIPSFISLSGRPDLRVATPSPPKLDDRETPERHAFLLMRWYEGAVRARFGKEPGAFKRYRNGPATSPHFALLVEAAKRFIAEDISPASWCAFSCQVWDAAEAKGLPPLKFMFSAKRIGERAGWYRSEAENYSGGRVLYSPLAKEFMTRQSGMRCFPASLRTEEQLAAHVARFFPGDLYEDLLTRLRAEGAALREELERVVSLGEWVW